MHHTNDSKAKGDPVPGKVRAQRRSLKWLYMGKAVRYYHPMTPKRETDLTIDDRGELFPHFDPFAAEVVRNPG